MPYLPPVRGHSFSMYSVYLRVRRSRNFGSKCVCMYICQYIFGRKVLSVGEGFLKTPCFKLKYKMNGPFYLMHADCLYNLYGIFHEFTLKSRNIPLSSESHHLFLSIPNLLPSKVQKVHSHLHMHQEV